MSNGSWSFSRLYWLDTHTFSPVAHFAIQFPCIVLSSIVSQVLVMLLRDENPWIYMITYFDVVYSKYEDVTFAYLSHYLYTSTCSCLLSVCVDICLFETFLWKHPPISLWPSPLRHRYKIYNPNLPALPLSSVIEKRELRLADGWKSRNRQSI